MPCKRSTKCAQTHGQTAGGTWERPRSQSSDPACGTRSWASIIWRASEESLAPIHLHLCLLLVFCWNVAYPAPSSHLQDYFILRRARAQAGKEPALWIQHQPLSTRSLPHYPHVSIMTPLLPVFLVVLVGLPVAQALECHVCAYNGENCFKPMRCPAMATYCMTTRTYFTPYRMKVRKSCVPSCFETVYDGYSKHASATSCCQYYLCNGAGFATPVTLALVPVLLATFWSLL
ncbi:ly-6/neurotoxin-like protein 1 isoform X2 [Peromyscus leucopus]|uniref:ly-6/neurotoxin-like protein 1 isoform X2 n=1 Tax=Peromyscus leucopus TaxID=10041 RepID=UPI0010A15D20|nr:ly-6/neurotoxin-like protein 1 isoform X2 [Peromyscus leucopus]